MLTIDPIWHADTQQSNFRQILEAMARPGHRYPLLTPQSEMHAVLGVLATLLDGEVSLADVNTLLKPAEWPLLQARSANAEQADYILADSGSAPNFQPKLGNLANPEQSATIILKVAQLSETQGATALSLRGPGIATQAALGIDGLHPDWLVQREDWICAFPLGVDLILVDDDQVAALPRTTQLEVN